MSRTSGKLGQKRNAYKDLLENPKERGHWEDLSMDGRIILK
jgi:hypothetical protein